MSIRDGSLTGDGVPSNHLTGLTQAKRSSFCLKATFNEVIPPPTGVVRGPFIPTKYLLNESRVSWGSHSPVWLNAFSPANTSNHSIFFEPE